jgi:hypothetical protein
LVSICVFLGELMISERPSSYWLFRERGRLSLGLVRMLSAVFQPPCQSAEDDGHDEPERAPDDSEFAVGSLSPISGTT